MHTQRAAPTKRPGTAPSRLASNLLDERTANASRHTAPENGAMDMNERNRR